MIWPNPKGCARFAGDHEKRVARLKARRPVNALLDDAQMDLDEVYGQGKLCVTCHK